MRKHMAVLLSLVFLVTFAAQPARADDPPGAKLFTNYCSGCHGAAGQGGMAPSIGGKDFLNAHNDAAIVQATSEGVVAKGMPAWSKANGGTLTDSQIADIVTYLRSLSPSGAAAQTAALDPSVSPASAPSDAQPAVDVVPVQTRIELKQLVYQDGRILVRAQLMEPDGYPVAGEPIEFSRPTEFGAIDLGTAKTGANGVASVTVTDAPPTGQIAVVFKGSQRWVESTAQAALVAHAAVTSGGFDPSRVSLAIGDEPLLPPEGSLITPNPPLIPAALFLGVVGCVWLLYAFVASQVVGIWREGRIAKRENTLTWKAK